MKESSTQQCPTPNLHLTIVSNDDQSNGSCNFLLAHEIAATEIDCSVDPSSATAMPEDQADTIQDIPMDELFKEIERRSQELKAAESGKVVEMSSSARWRENYQQHELKREYKIVFHGDEYAVLRVRLRTVVAQRDRMCAARAMRKASLNMSEVDAYSSARYKRNMTRASQRESTKAMVHWFGQVSHYKIVEDHLNRELDEIKQNKVLYTSNWSRNFHGLQEAHGY